MLNQSIKKVGRQQIRLLIISSFLLFTLPICSFCQVKSSPDTAAFKRDFEKLLQKYGIENKGYMINVTSISQKGGQTAFVINNNFYADSTLDSSNYIFQVITEGIQKTLVVSPKKGVWNSPTVLTDSLKSNRNFFDPGIGVVATIHGLSVNLDDKIYTLLGLTKSSVCSKNFPLYINLSGDKDEFYIFGDLQDNRKLYLFHKGKVIWYPMPEE